MNKSPLTQSLRARVTLSSLLIFLAGIWALEVYTNQMLREDMEHLLGQQQFSAVSVLAEEVSVEIDKRFRALDGLAKTASSLTGDPSVAMQSRLAGHPDLIELFNRGGFVTGRDGVAIASYPESMGRLGLNYMDRDYIQVALLQGKATVGRAVIGRPLGQPVILMATPIRDRQGQVMGAMVGVIDLGKPNFLDTIMTRPYGKTGGFFIASPQHRLIVTASDKSRVMQSLPPEGTNQAIDRLIRGFEGSILLTNQLGEQVLNSSKHIPLSGWDIVASLPAHEAFAPARALHKRMLVATSVMSVLVAGLMWWLLSWHLQPLTNIIKSLVGRRQPGELLEPLPIRRQDEIGQLMVAFNRLLEKLRQQDGELRLSDCALQSISEAVAITDSNHLVVYSNSAHEKITGYSPEDVMGQNLRLLQGPQTSAHTVSAIREALLKRVSFAGEILNYRKDGVPFWNELSIVPAFDAKANLTHFVGVTRDITNKKRLEDQVREMAYHDALTHLPNRRLLIDRLNQALISSRRNHTLGAVVFLDLDNFKPLNDSAGHAVGDLLLIEVAHRLQSCVRGVDTVARLGGDEFVVMLVDLPADCNDANAQALVIANEIEFSLAKPYFLQHSHAKLPKNENLTHDVVEHHCAASVGIALFGDEETNSQEILKLADAAMYRAKVERRNRTVLGGH